MIETGLVDLEGSRQRKDRLAMLDRKHAPRIETRTIAQTVDLIEDRHGRIARQHEIGMQRMRETIAVDGPLRRHQRLADDLPAEDALPTDLRAVAAKQVHLNGFEIKRRKHGFHRGEFLGLSRHFA